MTTPDKATMAEIEALANDVLARDAQWAPSGMPNDCNCINLSRKAKREYETGNCPHQRLRAALSRPSPAAEVTGERAHFWSDKCRFCDARFFTNWEREEHERKDHPSPDAGRVPEGWKLVSKVALERLFSLSCHYCANGWPMDDGHDGLTRDGFYHQEESSTKRHFGGGFVRCRASDIRVMLASPAHDEVKS